MFISFSHFFNFSIFISTALVKTTYSNSGFFESVQLFTILTSVQGQDDFNMVYLLAPNKYIYKSYLRQGACLLNKELQKYRHHLRKVI